MPDSRSASRTDCPTARLAPAAAVIHFTRRRPNVHWLYIIILLGCIDTLIYLVEALSAVGLVGQSFKDFLRRRSICLL